MKPNDQIKKLAAQEAKRFEDGKKGRRLTTAEFGFLVKNGVCGKTEKEIESLLSAASLAGGGALKGVGDKFKAWCEDNGRELPDDDLVAFINRNPYEAGQWVKKNVSVSPKVWKNWCTYHAGKGRHRV